MKHLSRAFATIFCLFVLFAGSFVPLTAQSKDDVSTNNYDNSGSNGVFYDSTAIADTSLKKLGKYTLSWSKTYVTFSEREDGRNVIKACYNHSYQYWEYQAGKSGYFPGGTAFDASSVDLSKLYKTIDKSIKLSRSAPTVNVLKPLFAKITYSGTKCSVGDIVLQDGSVVSASSFRANSRNPAIGVVAFFRDSNFPNSGDGGTVTGNLEDAVIIGTKREMKALIVPEKAKNFYLDESTGDNMLAKVHIYDITWSSAEKYSNPKKYTLESDTDGSNNYEVIKTAIDEAIAANPDFKRFGKISYPAFEAAENYGVTNNITGKFKTGWFIPTTPECDYLERNEKTINKSLEKISGADIFKKSEDYVAEVRDGHEYWGSRILKRSSPLHADQNTFISMQHTNEDPWELGLVYFIRNYADLDATYSGRPANVFEKGTYGEKPEANAVGDIVFSDGSATALRDGLILTTEQKKAVMGVGIYIGDGYIGEKGYLYVASVYRNAPLLILNNESLYEGPGSKIVETPITYDILLASEYPFEGLVTDGFKNWEYIKETIPWAVGEKDRNGDYVKGFTSYIYADLYGSGKSFSYKYIQKAFVESLPEHSSVTVTTPKLSGIYSNGWFVPSYAESQLAAWSFNTFGDLFHSVTELTVSDTTGSNRNISMYWSVWTVSIMDSVGPTDDVVFHKAGKVNQEDLKLSSEDFGPDRCYVGDIVLADGTFVRMDEYDYNPKNPAIGVVAFFKNKVKAKNSDITDYSGSKANAVILGLKMKEGTFQDAKDYATNYGKNNNITGIYKDGWYLPSLDDRDKINTRILGKSFAQTKDGAEAAGYMDAVYYMFMWTSAASSTSVSLSSTKSVSVSDRYNAFALHDYAEPVKFVENDHGLTTDWSHPYKVGDIVLADGSIVAAAQYKANTRNPAVGVIAFFKDSSFPNSGNYGSRTGTKEDAYIIGLQQKHGVVQWAANGAQGLKNITTAQTYPSSFGYGAANTASFYPGSDNDGSDNWSHLCAAVTDENISGKYPLFEYAASYGKTAGITGSYSSGWYVPTIAELSYVYRNKRFINESMELIDGAMRISGALYRSSSQGALADNSSYSMNGITGSIEFESKTMDYDGHGVLVIRPLSTSYKAPVQWYEPVVKTKTATNPLLKRSYSGQIGEKAKPTAVGDIIFSDGSATSYSYSVYSLTQKQKDEAVAIAAFIGDGTTGQKGKIYGISLVTNVSRYFNNSSRLNLYAGSHTFNGYTWCNAKGDDLLYHMDEYYGTPHLKCDGSVYWKEICKIDPYGAENSAAIYPAWDFVLNLGEGWFIGNSAEMKMVLDNRNVINKSRIALNYEELKATSSSTYSVGDGEDEYSRNFYGLYAFDLGTESPAQAQNSSETNDGDFVFVQGGTFSMGSTSGYDNEQPVHSVTIGSFYMCDHEVTQGEFEEIMGMNPSLGIYVEPTMPVEQVSWFDAIEYCNALSKKEGLKPCYTKNGKTYTCDFSANGYRLPTEAEWEYAASGGNKSNGYTYSGTNDLDRFAWYEGNTSFRLMYGVKSKLPNELGLFDMSGSVWEWCWDSWKDSYSGESAGTGNWGHAMRGGSICNDAFDCRITRRTNMMFAQYVGFRIVRSANGATQSSQGAQSVQVISPSDDGMVFVQSGSFNMGGDPIYQYSHYNSEQVIHKVTLSNFYICDHEVTQNEFFSVMGTNPSQNHRKDLVRDDYPVENVAWYSAIEYCNRRSIIEGLNPCYSLYGETDPHKWDIYAQNSIECDWSANGYRLPTEAEWEFSARGGNKSKGYKFSGSDNLSDVGGTSSSTRLVKTKQPNELGIYDMSGNVAEIVWDKWGDYSDKAVTDPKGPANGLQKVMRGGGYNDKVEYKFYVYIRNTLSGDQGFRVARTTLAVQPIKVQTAEEQTKKSFVLVQGGTFKMGSTSGENDEKPVHSVTLSSFYMSDHEVTQAEYKTVMGTNPSSFKGDYLPVEQVSWYDAIEYCNKLSKKEGLKPCYSLNGKTDTSSWGAKGTSWNSVVCDWSADGYRLPTEAEWEYAARGGNKSKGYKYSGSNKPVDVAWSNDTSKDKTHNVKAMAANELGLYDMSGNVSEWVWDWYGTYGSASVTDPKGPSSGSYRSRRGGSWSDAPSATGVTYRDGNSPARTKNDRGFRVVRSAK